MVNPTKQTLKIVTADDDATMRLILKRIIEQIPNTKVVGEAENGIRLIEMVDEIKPDAVFIDVDMPEKNGVESAKEIL